MAERETTICQGKENHRLACTEDKPKILDGVLYRAFPLPGSGLG